MCWCGEREQCAGVGRESSVLVWGERCAGAGRAVYSCGESGVLVWGESSVLVWGERCAGVGRAVCWCEVRAVCWCGERAQCAGVGRESSVLM